MEKECSKCHRILSIEDFVKDSRNSSGYGSRCKDCERNQRKQYYENNKERISKRNKEYSKSHRDKINKKRRQNVEADYERYQKMWHDYYESHKKQHSENGRKWVNKQRKENPLFRLKSNVRSMIGHSFHRTGWFKKALSEEIIGMNIDEFVLYLLQTYKDFYGYEWDRKEKVHIDHIIPISTAKNEEDVISLCHYTNLRLLKASDNMSKSDKLDWVGDS